MIGPTSLRTQQDISHRDKFDTTQFWYFSQKTPVPSELGGMQPKVELETQFRPYLQLKIGEWCACYTTREILT